MNRLPRPPRLAVWLMRARLSGDWFEYILGDLEEEFATRAARSAPAARVWFWGQALRSIAAPPPAHGAASLDAAPRRASLLAECLGDLRSAARVLFRSPGFALLAVGIMALGIGANTAAFTVVNGVLLKPLPYPEPDRIVALRTAFLEAGGTQPQVAIANYRDWRDRSTAFEAMASYRGGGEAPISAGANAEYTRAASVDVDFFRVLGVPPVLGRTFTPQETTPNAPGVVVISYGYWQSRFGGDPRVLERSLRVGVSARPIVGVMPPGFGYPADTDVWTAQTTSSTSRTSHSFLVVARLKPQVSLEQARAELTAIAKGLEGQYPDSNKGRGVAAVALQEELVKDVRLTLYLVWGVVGLVLLVACANTATLVLGRATARTHEMAVRAALGATRGRIVRQLVAESVVLALVAAAVGVVIAQWGSQALVAMSPADVVRRAGPGLDLRVFSFTLAVSLATSLFFGLFPALHASKVDLIDTVKLSGTRSLIGGRAVRTRGLLVVVEVALAVVLLIGAGLLLRSLLALHRVHLGFSPDNVLVVRATGVRARVDNDAYFAEVMTRLARLPGVTAVGATSIPPGDWANAGTGGHFIDTLPPRVDRKSPLTLMTIAAPGSFAALRIPVTQGRDFDEGDTADRPLVAVVNEALVRASFPGRDPIGSTIYCTFDRSDPMTVVGVVGDVRQRDSATPAMPECYMPYRQHSYNNATLSLLVRTAGATDAMVGPIRQAAAEVSPDVPLSFSTMADRVSRGVEDSRFRALLFGLFAVVAVCLAAAGVYGVMAHAVAARSREVGLRMALGASQASVLRLILKQGMALVLIGVVVGVTAAAAAARFLEAVLFEVQPLDAGVYLGVAFLLTVVAIGASIVPARRASGVDPVKVLKAD